MIISGIQRQEKQREAWIELLRLLHDPNNNFCHHQPQLVRLEEIMRANWSCSGCRSWQSVLLLKKVWIMGSLSHPTHPSYFSAGAPQPPLRTTCLPQSALLWVFLFLIYFILRSPPYLFLRILWEWDIIHLWACEDLHDWSLCVVFQILSKIYIDLFAVLGLDRKHIFDCINVSSLSPHRVWQLKCFFCVLYELCVLLFFVFCVVYVCCACIVSTTLCVP